MTDNKNVPAGKPVELDDDQLESAAGGSASSTGAGAGKVTFNPFTITRNIDISTP